MQSERPDCPRVKRHIVDIGLYLHRVDRFYDLLGFKI